MTHVQKALVAIFVMAAVGALAVLGFSTSQVLFHGMAYGDTAAGHMHAIETLLISLGFTALVAKRSTGRI